MFVNAIMYYKVSDATSAVTNVDDYSGSARLLAATTLRNVLGTKNLGDILSERELIANEMQELLHEATEPWGVKIERVEVKDCRVPEQLMRAMAAEAEAAREARAKVIAAEGEHKASRALRLAAEVIMENPAALQVTILANLKDLSQIVCCILPAAVPADPEQHLRGEQQHHHLPRAGGHDQLLLAKQQGMRMNHRQARARDQQQINQWNFRQTSEQLETRCQEYKT